MTFAVNIRLAEWETRTPQNEPTLRDTRLVADADTRLVVEHMARADILNIVELRDGLSIEAFAHVGKIEIGNVTVTIRPKIPAPPCCVYCATLTTCAILTYSRIPHSTANPKHFKTCSCINWRKKRRN